MPILNLGVDKAVEVRFPRGGGESKVMEIRKVIEEGGGRKQETELERELLGKHHRERKRHAESFVKDGVVYFWEVEMDDRRQKGLFKVSVESVFWGKMG